MATATAKSENVKEVLKIGAYLGIGYLGYKAVKGLAETFGLLQTGNEDLSDEGTEGASGSTTEISSNPFLAFNGTYAVTLIKDYNKKYKPKVFDAISQQKLSRADIILLALQIKKAKGLPYLTDDDELSTYSAFNRLQTQYQLSVLASVFNYYYKEDLLEFIKSYLNPDELAKILNKVKNFPKYYKP